MCGYGKGVFGYNYHNIYGLYVEGIIYMMYMCIKGMFGYNYHNIYGLYVGGMMYVCMVRVCLGITIMIYTGYIYVEGIIYTMYVWVWWGYVWV